MSTRQSKLVHIAHQHSFQATPVEGSDRVIEVAVPYTAFDAATGVRLPGGTDYERVSTVEELLAVLGY